MPTHLDSVVVDTADPAALALWWSQALGWTVTDAGPRTSLGVTATQDR